MPEFVIVRINGPQGTEPLQAERPSDLLALADRLTRRSDPLTRWLWAFLAPQTQAVLGGPGGAPRDPTSWKAGLLEDLERLAHGPSIYETARFQGVPLSPATSALLNSGPPGPEAVRLNRLLLCCAFPELRRNATMNSVWLGKVDTLVLVGRSGKHRISVDLPGAETQEATIEDTTSTKPLEIVVRWAGLPPKPQAPGNPT